MRAMCLAVPGKILSIEGENDILRSAKVDFGGVIKDIVLAYVPEARVGEFVLVHAGFALNVIDEAEARQVFEYLRQIDELGGTEGAERQ